MSWLGGKRIATEVSRALAIGDDETIVVGFDSKLAARLAASGASITFVSDVARDVQRATTNAIALEELADLDAVGGAVVVGAASRDDRTDVLAAFRRAVHSGARVALVDRVQRSVAARAALAAGLSRLEQRSVGRVIVTVGSRPSFDDATALPLEANR